MRTALDSDFTVSPGLADGILRYQDAYKRTRAHTHTHTHTHTHARTHARAHTHTHTHTHTHNITSVSVLVVSRWLGLEVGPFISSDLFPAFQRIVNFFTKKETYYPYDVSCNLIRAADHTLVHSDCGHDQLDATLIVYLNPNWTVNLHGETVFFTGDTPWNAESITAVRPRYGRVVIFNGTFLHSARPPSPTFAGNHFYEQAVK